VEEADKKEKDFNRQGAESRLIELNRKLKYCERDIKNKESIVNELSKKHSAAMGRSIEARSNVKSEEAVAKVKIDALNSEMKKEISNLSRDKSSKGAFIIASIVTAAVSILSGIFVNSVFFAGILISLIFIIIGGKNNKSYNKLNNVKEQLKNNAEKKEKDILSKIDKVKAAEDICNKEEVDLLSELNKAEQEFQYVKTYFESIKAEINKESNEIEKAKLNHEIAEENLQKEIAFLNGKKQLCSKESAASKCKK
jgi:hypothetical protein